MREFYEKFYLWELDRKSKIQTAVSFPVGLGAIGAAIMKFAIENFSPNDNFEYVLLLPLVPAAIALFQIFYHCLKAIGLSRYKTIPKMDEIKEFQDRLHDFSLDQPGSRNPIDAFDEHVIERLADCAGHNSKVNDRRATSLYKANKAVFVLILFSLTSAAMVLADKEF